MFSNLILFPLRAYFVKKRKKCFVLKLNTRKYHLSFFFVNNKVFKESLAKFLTF